MRSPEEQDLGFFGSGGQFSLAHGFLVYTIVNAMQEVPKRTGRNGHLSGVGISGYLRAEWCQSDYRLAPDWAKPLFYTWVGIRQRCANPRLSRWNHYGGRGIFVCARWRHSFVNFYTDMGPKPDDSYEIDRVDVNGNYEPANCRWATTEEQARNRRDSETVENSYSTDEPMVEDALTLILWGWNFMWDPTE